jgi:uncharacterized protein YebE (UPF0316 family)
VLLPLFIFFARVVDVSLGTIRIIFISRGMKTIAPLVGFVEVIVWLLAIGQIMQNITDVYCYLAYGAGFATGTFIGMLIENRLAMGISLMHIIATDGAESLIEDLKQAGCGVTVVDAQGLFQRVKLIFSVVKRKQIRPIVQLIQQHNPSALYLVEDVRTVSSRIIHDWHREYKRP